MTKRKHSAAFGAGTHPGRFWRPLRHIRQHRRAAHFSFSHVENMDEGHTSNGHKPNHEAQMIPGVDGKKIFGFPNSIITKLRYKDYLTLTCTSGAIARNQFCANGIFDPDLTNVGHQPMYRDDYNRLYDFYVVLGSKITATFACSTTGKNLIIGICGDNDTSAPGISSSLEGNNSYSTMLGAVGSPTKTITAVYEPLEMLGVAAGDDGQSLTAFSANPTNQWIFNVWAAPADATSTVTWDVLIEIEYTVKCAKLFTQAQN